MDRHFEMFREGTLSKIISYICLLYAMCKNVFFKVGSYGKIAVDEIYRHLNDYMDIKGKHVLVIGSQRPWLETLILEAGAGTIYFSLLYYFTHGTLQAT